MDNEGHEVNDCAVSVENYSGYYGEALADRDMEVYEEQLLRDYSNVGLRSAVTELKANVNLEEFSGNGKTGFAASVQASGTIQADHDGPLERFSLYAVIPEGLMVDLDNQEVKSLNGYKYLKICYHINIL